LSSDVSRLVALLIKLLTLLFLSLMPEGPNPKPVKVESQQLLCSPACVSVMIRQDTYKQLITLHITFNVVVNALENSIQQSVLGEPVSRLLELLLYGE
jgi:hypothetical protein